MKYVAQKNETSDLGHESKHIDFLVRHLISIIFDCSRSGPVQDSITPLFDSF